MTSSATGPKTRLVAGCGPLGMRVAKRWLAAGDRVWGITRGRREALAAEGLEPIVADIAAGPLDLPPVETAFWAVGFDAAAGHSPHDLHVGGLQRLLAALPSTTRILYSSTTGVWGKAEGEVVDEETPATPGRPSADAALEAERFLSREAAGRSVVLRFAGLYGPGRLPRLDDLREGRPIPADPESWLNLIHLDDAAGIVCRVAELADPRPLYVVSDGRPLTRGHWYTRLAELTGSPPPTFAAASPRSRGGNKRVNPSRLFADLAAAGDSQPLSHPDALAAVAELAD